MKELERWWRWFDNEKPGLDLALSMMAKRLDDAEREAMRSAAAFVHCRRAGMRLFFVAPGGKDDNLREALEHNPGALRELALDLFKAFKRLKEQVGIDPVSPWRLLGEHTADSFAYAMSKQPRFSEAFLRNMYSDRSKAEQAYISGGYFVRATVPGVFPTARIMSVDP